MLWKKLVFFLAFTLFSIFNFAKVDFKGYEIEGSLGLSILSVNGNLAFEPKWGAELPNNTAVEFGPKLTLNQSLTFGLIGTTTANVGFSTEFNFGENKPVKGYLGLEIGVGAGVLYAPTVTNIVSPIPNGIGKVSGGAKINNHKIGAYLGYGKGIFGVEYGYTLGK